MIIEGLVQKRDARRDGFAQMIQKAMGHRLADDAEKVQRFLSKHGVTRQAAKQAIAIAGQQGQFTLWSLVDALTRLARDERNAGDRLAVDETAAQLLAAV